MSKMCGNCKGDIEVGERYVEYGGLCWCDEDCLAEYYVENEGRFLASRNDAEAVEQKLEHRVLDE